MRLGADPLENAGEGEPHAEATDEHPSVADIGHPVAGEVGQRLLRAVHLVGHQLPVVDHNRQLRSALHEEHGAVVVGHAFSVEDDPLLHRFDSLRIGAPLTDTRWNGPVGQVKCQGSV